METEPRVLRAPSLAEPGAAGVCSRCQQQVPGPGQRSGSLTDQLDWSGAMRQAPAGTGWWCSTAGRAGPLGGGGPVGVPQHGVEGPGEVVGLSAAIVLFRRGQQTGQQQEQEQEQLQGQRGPDHP